MFEKNKPATFDHPLWSLRADFKMLGLALRLKMRAEVERVCGGSLAPGHTHDDHLHLGHGVNGLNGANGAAEAPVA